MAESIAISNTVEHKPVIIQKVDYLDDQISHLDGQLAQLFNSISPILRPEYDSPGEGEKGVDNVPQSDIAQVLDRLTYRLRVISNSITSTIDRVEL